MIEKHLPAMIEELLVRQVEKSVKLHTEGYAKSEEVAALLEQKLPWNHFREYERRQIANNDTKDTMFVVNERIHTLERLAT